MATSDLVPTPFPVAINGRPFAVDKESKNWFEETIPLIRPQSDNSESPGERSLNPEAFWRRAMESWHHGAGQRFLDRVDSDPFRFYQSAGIDVWDPFEIKVLDGVTTAKASANSNVHGIGANGFAYVVDGQEVYFSTNYQAPFTWTAANIAGGEAAATLGSINRLATDGATVYAVFTDGIHTTAVGAAVSAHYADNPAGKTYDCIAFFLGRLMAAADNSLYNIVAAGAAPAALYAHPNAAFTWRCFAQSQTHVYAAGDDGYVSTIMKTRVNDAGTGMDVPSSAAPPLPYGERVLSMLGDGSVMGIGTTKGVRLAAIGDDGNLTIGGIVRSIPPGQPDYAGASEVRALAARDRFIYVGNGSVWAAHLAGGVGLGRLDLTQFTDPAALIPAFASDLISPTGSDVSSVFVHPANASYMVFTVPGIGVIAQAPGVAPAVAKLDTGLITYGLAEQKMPVNLDEHVFDNIDVATVASALSIDGGATFTSIGAATNQSKQFDLDTAKVARFFELRFTLNAAARLYRATLMVEPIADGGLFLFVPLELAKRRGDDFDGEDEGDPEGDHAAIEALRQSRLPVPYQKGTETTTVIVVDHRWEQQTVNTDGVVEGTLVVKMKKVA